MHPSPWLLRFAPLLPPQARVLDLACGAGRHANWLCQKGFSVTAVDRDGAALAQVDPRAERLQLDLEGGPWPLGGRRFDAVLVTNYLWRPRLPELLACVGDWYLHETFALGQEQLGRPRNPDFLLRPGELLALCQAAQLHVLAYEDGVVNGARIQRIAARRQPGALPL
ncbi:MAG: class I SAM-dependent methyltransferase [Burkholderiales bacterium]|nr:class I SAM-dependent methyltransferase [Burkholderiales bacterium]